MALETVRKNAMPKSRKSGHPSGVKRFSLPAVDWPLRPVVAMLLLAAIIIGWPWLSGRVTIPWDAKAHFQPQIQFLAQSLARGESPAWAPYRVQRPAADRRPAVDDLLPAVPCAGAADGAPSLWAVDTTVLACVFLGGAALMLWFRDQGWHWAGGLIAALAFGYGASMAWRIQHIGQVLSLAYLPSRCSAWIARWHAARSSTASPPESLPPASCWGATRWRCSASISWRAWRSGASC